MFKILNILNNLNNLRVYIIPNYNITYLLYTIRVSRLTINVYTDLFYVLLFYECNFSTDKDSETSAEIRIHFISK